MAVGVVASEMDGRESETIRTKNLLQKDSPEYAKKLYGYFLQVHVVLAKHRVVHKLKPVTHPSEPYLSVATSCRLLLHHH